MEQKLLLLIATAAFVTSCAQPKSKFNEQVNAEQPGMEAPVQPDAPDALEAKNIIDYKVRYKVLDPFTKVTDNRGNGFENLYGTRNFRVVLHGVYYRGGANNVYNREGVRDNSNPLPANGLDNLCREGFSTAIYFYPTNYSSAPKQVNCRDRKDENNTLNYKQISSLNVNNHEAIISLIYSRIKGQLKAPIYGHCWNGWHASGLAAAIALKQFCNYSNAKAVEYWKKNTDGNTAGYESVIKKLEAFKPIEKYKVSADESAKICPTN
jgi:hypothetical protein